MLKANTFIVFLYAGMTCLQNKGSKVKNGRMAIIFFEMD
jgi:hypothetical protein